MLKKAIWRLLNTIGLGAYVQLCLYSALKEDGWFLSFKTKQSVDGKNNPIPWFSYPFNRFIIPRIKREFTLFEYGSGNSTIWWASRVKSITAAEHEPAWYESVKKRLPGNARVILAEFTEDGEYAKSILKDGVRYDVVIVDGVDRVNCVKYAVSALTQAGVIIVDNSERVEYQPAYDLLASEGFKRLEFTGMTAIVAFNSSTSVFYRPGNCLDI